MGLYNNSSGFRSLIPARCTTIVSRSCPIHRRRKTEVQRREPGLPLESESSQARPAADLPPAPHNPCVQREKSRFLFQSLPRASRVLDALSVPERDCDQGVVGDDPNIAHSPDANTPFATVVIPPSPKPLVDASGYVGEVLTSRGPARPSFSHKLDPVIALPRQSGPSKPLKPLGSLLDGLREIARSAAQTANAPEAHTTICARPDALPKEDSHGDSDCSGYPSRSAPSRPSTAQPPVSSCSVLSATGQAQFAGSLAPRSSKRSHGSIGDLRSVSSGSPKDDGSSSRVNVGCDIDAHLGTNRVDVLAILQRYQHKTILLPSSPLPGWNALPCFASTTNASYSQADGSGDT